MATNPADELVDLCHDVIAKCSNLKRAATQLHGVPTDRELELVRLMEEQARSVAERIASYASVLRGGRRK